MKTARGICERCGVAVIDDRANDRVWAHCVCVGCLPPPPPPEDRGASLPIRPWVTEHPFQAHTAAKDDLP